MSETANISGAFMRPTLVDYLIVAEQRELRVDLFVYVGSLELGVLGVDAGRVVYAELPGSAGDAALGLLVRMPGTRVMPERGTTRPVNVQRSWREFVSDASAAGQAWRLDHVRAELDGLGESAPHEGREGPEGPGPQPHDPELLRVVGELLDWAAADACLHEDIEGAHELLTRREQLCPADLVCASNLERLHLRLLEDEIAASVVGEGVGA